VKTLLKHWAIVYNPTKPGTEAVAARILKALEGLQASGQIHAGAPDSLRGYNAAITIGGDGTMLHCAEQALEANVPLAGVNMGTLGYMTGIGVDEVEESMRRIFAGEFLSLERMALRLDFPDGTVRHALNDLVLKSADFRLTELRVSVDGEYVTEYPCDGLIFATPTGSTAYNLSAGGPIVHTSASGIIMTPICAHTLTNRSIIFNERSTLTVERCEEKTSIHINVDGRTTAEGTGCLPVRISSAQRRLTTLEDPRRGGFATLRQKLNWQQPSRTPARN
jgi:NAD+ kinase